MIRDLLLEVGALDPTRPPRNVFLYAVGNLVVSDPLPTDSEDALTIWHLRENPAAVGCSTSRWRMVRVGVSYVRERIRRSACPSLSTRMVPVFLAGSA